MISLMKFVGTPTSHAHVEFPTSKFKRFLCFVFVLSTTTTSNAQRPTASIRSDSLDASIILLMQPHVQLHSPQLPQIQSVNSDNGNKSFSVSAYFLPSPFASSILMFTTPGTRGMFDGITGTWMCQTSHSICRYWAYNKSKKLGARKDAPAWKLAAAGNMGVFSSPPHPFSFFDCSWGV